MAICPFAVQQIIPESYTQGRITPTTLIYHRAVSSAESLRNYWNTPGVELESHFHIGQFGVLYQFMDTNVRADANVDANGFAISVESWDGGNTPDSMPWNPAQLATAKRLAAWVCETHGVKRAAAQTWNGGGIGGHNWFPIPWADGPRGCPGTARNAQIRNDIIPYAAGGGGWRDIEEDDMFSNDDRVVIQEIWAAIDALSHGHGKRQINPDKGEAVEQVQHWYEIQHELRRMLALQPSGDYKSDQPGYLTPPGKDFALVTLLKGLVSDLAAVKTDVADLKTSGVPVVAEIDYARVRDEVGDELDERNRDGNPNTGSPS